MNKQDQINLHSEELSEVLGTPPSWLARWGTLIAYIAFFMMIAVAYFVKYPDVIMANVELVYPNPSLDLIAEQNGLIEQVLVNADEMVTEGQLLLVYSSTAKAAHIDTLEKDLRYFNGEPSDRDVENFTPRLNLQLGELQEEYSKFIKNFDAFVYGEVANNDQKSVNRKNAEIREIRALIDIEKDKKQNLNVRYKMAVEEADRIQGLYSSNQEKYREPLSVQAQKVKDIESEFSNLDANIKYNLQRIQNLGNDIQEIRQQSGSDNSYLKFTITESINKLKGQITSWKNKNLISAPISGRVIFNEYFEKENQSVRVGTKLLEIIPPGEDGEIFAKVDLPITGSGKVETGQTVVIKIKNYPHQEYGMLMGTVRKKGDVPQENNTYKVEVELTNGLKTSRGHQLNYTQGMQGTAEIITKEQRFLMRLFENVFGG